MAFFIANDIHGNKPLLQGVVNAIESKMAEGDILLVNGDGAGARGPRMNEVIKIYYEVRRGETAFENLLTAIETIIGEKPVIPENWVFNSVHGGVFRKIVAEHYPAFNACLEEELRQVLEETLRPLAVAAEKGKKTIIYVPGNGEIVPSDLSIEDISTEQALPPEQRFYQRLAKEGYFDTFGIHYVPYAEYVNEGVAVISTNLLDLNFKDALNVLNEKISGRPLKNIIVHYPPKISPLGGMFSFWKPNTVDAVRSRLLNRILAELNLDEATVYFGHIHLGVSDPKMRPYPALMMFQTPSYNYAWVKPGTVIKI